jgi:hypothetical protein
MKGQLNLTFSHHGGPEVSGLPLVVDVAKANLEPAVSARSITVGAGWQRELVPGTYLARVYFPSGELVQQTCTIRDGEQTEVNVDIPNLNLAGRERLERSAVLRPLLRDETTPGLAGENFTSTWAKRWHRTSTHRWTQIGFDGMTLSRDNHTVQYRFELDTRPQLLQLGGESVPWRFVTLPPTPAVDVTISAQGQSELDIEVTTGSNYAEALLGYLRSGAVDGARAIAEALLRQKADDPIAAVVGGYYLLRNGHFTNLPNLPGWANNLSHWFHWLPDGAVINAWQHLQAGKRRPSEAEGHFDRARHELLLATRRGIPVYTEGLTLLLEGLELMGADANNNDPELNTALEFIRPYATAADPTSTTVTYGAGDTPSTPTASPATGFPKSRKRLVLLQQVQLPDLVDLGWLSPGSRLESSGGPAEATATVTSAGELDVAGAGIFDTPESTGRDALDLEYPELSWLEWRISSPSELTPKAAAASQQLGLTDPPTLNDLRSAARGTSSTDARSVELAARGVARRLADENVPHVEADVEAALQNRETPESTPDDGVDEASLGALIVSAATLGSTIYNEIREQTREPSPEVVASQLRRELPLAEMRSRVEDVISAVVDEITTTPTARLED